MSNNESAQDNLTESLVTVRRTAKVVKGGRRFGFSALVVVGNGQGRVGYGLGKSKEVTGAIAKGMEAAKQMMNSKGSKILLNGKTIYHPVKSKYKASNVHMKPSEEGAGIIAGGAMRAVFECAGIENITGKSFGSRNPINVVVSTIKGLQSISSPIDMAKKRGISINELFDSEVTKG
jgi:small subunit ribosomal protein S5